MHLAMRSTWILVAALAVAGCGDDTTSGDTSGHGSSAGGPGSTSGTPGTTSGTPATGSGSGEDSGSSGQGMDTTEGATDTGATDTGATETGATDTGATDTGATDTGGMASMNATMSQVQFFQDCMPIVSPDPLGANFTLSLENTGMVAASADIVAVNLLDAGMVAVGSFSVTPTALGPVDPGQTSMFAIMKTANSLMPANGCGVATCNGTYTIEVELDVGGQSVFADASGVVACVF